MQSIFSSRTSKNPSRNPNNLNHFRQNQVTFGSKSLKGEQNKKILFHSFVATIISMSTVKKFLKSDMGIRFYGFSKLGIWGFA